MVESRRRWRRQALLLTWPLVFAPLWLVVRHEVTVAIGWVVAFVVLQAINAGIHRRTVRRERWLMARQWHGG